MKLIKPRYSIISRVVCDRVMMLIESAGRTCYKSEEKITDKSAPIFVEKIMKSGHHSVIEHFNISVKFICDRGVTHELVRHRLASYSQESTRYCNYSKDKFNGLTFILPPWFKEIKEGEYKPSFMMAFSNLEELWVRRMIEIEESYLILIREGWTPQQARSILPNALKTEIVCTANLREWRHILKLRTSPKAHPQIREIMIPLLEELRVLLPEIFTTLD